MAKYKALTGSAVKGLSHGLCNSEFCCMPCDMRMTNGVCALQFAE